MTLKGSHSSGDYLTLGSIIAATNVVSCAPQKLAQNKNQEVRLEMDRAGSVLVGHGSTLSGSGDLSGFPGAAAPGY